MTLSDNNEQKPGTYTEHLMSCQELAQKFKTSIDSKDVAKSAGLKSSECAQRLLEFGPNRLTPPKTMSMIERILRTVFLDAFMVMLLAASILTFITWLLSPSDNTNLYLAIVLLAIVLLTTTLTLYQEGKASDVMSGFKNLLPTTSFVIRNGSKTKVLSTELVKGDIVLLETGDKVPADLRILSSNSLKVDNSSLTGEYLPVSLTVDPNSEEALEARNIAFSGTLAVEGTGIGVCIRTGDFSYVGSIAALASQTGSEKSTLTKEIELFVRFVGILAFCSGLALFIVYLIRSGTSLKSIVDGIINTFVVVIVANVPQGLPSAVAGCLTVAAVNLANRNVYVKSLNAIETLGSVSVIASDKTGTLTKNQMTVISIWLNEQSRQVNMLHRPDDRNYRQAEGEIGTDNPLADALGAMLFISATCNQASLLTQRDSVVIDEEILITSNEEESLGIGNRRPTATSMLFSGRDPPGAMLSVAALAADSNSRPDPVAVKNLSGNASDIALYIFADTYGVKPVQMLREEWRQVFLVPFSSARKWMATVMAPPSSYIDQSRVLCVKGAPERILARCTHMLLNGQIVPLSKAMLQSFEQSNSRYMKQGRRVLGMAFKRLSLSDYPSKLESTMEQMRFQGIFDSGKLIAEPEQMTDGNGLVLVGCTALEDPPKESVPEAVLRCREAGIKVVMVTGDHPATATAIAKQCNIMGLYKTKEDLQQSENSNGSHAVRINDNDSEIGGVVVTGKELSHFTDADWNRVLSKPEIVFARTSPHDKLEIVSRLQKRGEIVAVTGDGVNDSPALKRADVGVAMGISGSEVAKEAGDIILIDDEFMSLVAGIEQGRIIFDNLTKLVAYTLTHLMPELVAVLIGLGLGAPVGMTSLMILSIDLLTEMGPSLSLAYEGAEDTVMFRPPRDINKDRLVSKSLLGYAYIIAGCIETIPCLFAFFAVFYQHHIRLADLVNTSYFQPGSAPYRNTAGELLTASAQMEIAANAQTAFYCTLVLGQFFHIWMCKTRVVSIFEHGLFGNVVMDMGVLVTLGSMLTITYVPAFQTIFGTAIQDQFWFFVPSLISFAALWLWNEGRKLCFRRYPNSRFTKIFGW